MRDSGGVPELAGRVYVPKMYPIQNDRAPVIALLADGIHESGGRVIYNSFDGRLAPVYIGAEDRAGHRFGLLIYPFTTTRRPTRNRPMGERRTQIRFGDPTREREESNPIARDSAGVDVTLVLGVDPEERFIVGLDPLVYEDLPMGSSVYYRDRHVGAAAATGWAVWESTKRKGKRRRSSIVLETLVGFRPHRLLDYARFEARASALGLTPDLRQRLAEEFETPEAEPHRLEDFFGVDATTILNIIENNFRLGVAVRGGVAEHHLGVELQREPVVVAVRPIDADAQPDFHVETANGTSITIECKTASKNRYKNGDYKVEVQKTRDSGAGRKYSYGQFDVLAACLFSATGLWEFRFRLAKDLDAAKDDPSRIEPIQRIDDTWARSLNELLR